MNSYTYTPFGEPLTGEGSGYRFNGEYYDSATGMLNLRARQYEPSVMRFSQRDLLKGDQSAPLSLNRYLYCENDSVNFVNPSGKSLSELWEKAKTAVSNGASVVKKVATAAYNAGKTIVKSAIQQVATVVNPVVNKVVNTVKEIATVAKTQGLVAAAKTLASNVASVPAYVKNVVSATAAERQAVQAKSAQQLTSISRDLDKDLRSIGKDIYETLSPRNKKIIDDTTKTVEYMQQNGASQAAIDRVILGACTQIAKNVGETVANGIYEAIVPEPIRIDIANFDPNNTSETVVLDANVFSMYKGSLVIRHNIPNTTSCGVFRMIFLNKSEISKRPESIETVKHEYGHNVQEALLGTGMYIMDIAVPSLLSANVPYSDYYSLPWERSADMFGGANHINANGSPYTYISGSDTLAEYYFDAAMLESVILNGILP